MAYTHLTINELIWIENYYESGKTPTQISRALGRARQTVYNVINALKKGSSIQDYYETYKKNKQRCGAKRKSLSQEERAYVMEKLEEGWSPDVIEGRGEVKLCFSARTLYRRFKEDASFDVKKLPMKGKRRSNGEEERRGRQQFRRSLEDREKEFPGYNEEFGHLEGDTIVGKDHKSAVITLVERKTKAIIVLKPKGRKAKEIEERIQKWMDELPRNLFKSITFDCGKEFSNWKNICNKQDISIFFADPGCPSQRGLNENSNGLLRRDGLPKQTDFREMEETDIISVASHRNNIPRKSLNYKTPMEVFIEYVYQCPA